MAPVQRSVQQPLLPAPLRLQKHGGIFTAVNPSDWLRHWRHPNHLMLAVPWPGFFGLIAAGYLLLNLLFAFLYWLDPHGIAGVAGETTSFAEAFFFSVQTLGSIGYGAFHPANLFTHLVVTIESLLGLLVIALMTGMAFSRFSSSTARILFSEAVTVHDYDGQPTLMFRVANERRKTILEARIQAYLAIDERTVEGHRMRRLCRTPWQGNHRRRGSHRHRGHRGPLPAPGSAPGKAPAHPAGFGLGRRRCAPAERTVLSH